MLTRSSNPFDLIQGGMKVVSDGLNRANETNKYYKTERKRLDIEVEHKRLETKQFETWLHYSFQNRAEERRAFFAAIDRHSGNPEVVQMLLQAYMHQDQLSGSIVNSIPMFLSSPDSSATSRKFLN